MPLLAFACWGCAPVVPALDCFSLKLLGCRTSVSVAGTIGYILLNIAAATGIVASTLVFISLLVFEIYRSIKFARVHDVARQVEEEAVEVSLTTLALHIAAAACTGASLCRGCRRWQLTCSDGTHSGDLE